MTTALVVPTLQDPTMGNHSPGGLFGTSCERRANRAFVNGRWTERLRRKEEIIAGRNM
jgi:hypothetical protein